MIAYLDAATGSVIIQVVAGGMASVYAYLKYRAGSFRRLGRTSSDSSKSHRPETVEAS